MKRHEGEVLGFVSGSSHERARADRFLEDLFRPPPGVEARAARMRLRRGGAGAEAEDAAAEDAPTIRLSKAEVLVCVGGVNNATVSAITTGGGTVTWRIVDSALASVTGAGNTATIRGKHPGVTTVEATLTSGATTVTATARLLVIFIQLILRNTGTIEPSPENEDEAAERAAAGGTNVLGPLPMGTGRADPPFAGNSFISPIMVVGRVFPDEAARRFNLRWQRLLTARSWRIRRNAAGTRWNVTFRGSSGPLADDTGGAAFNDATPSTPGRRIYIYDNSGLNLGPETIAVGEFIHFKKDFIYRVWIQLDGVWTLCSAIHVGQVIVARRDATSGTVASDWTGIENSNAIRRVTMSVDAASIRAIVGGTDPIDIAAGANP